MQGNQRLNRNIAARTLSEGLISRAGREAGLIDLREDTEHSQGYTYRQDH